MLVCLNYILIHTVIKTTVNVMITTIIVASVIVVAFVHGVQASGLEDHWAVREEAARLALVCSKYGEPYYQIQPRITQALNTAFQQSGTPLTTHYGKHYAFMLRQLISLWGQVWQD